MTMEELVLAKVIELAGRPTVAQLAAANADVAMYRKSCERLQTEAADRRKDAAIADLALTELWKAAEAMMKADPAKVSVAERGKLRQALGAALVAAQPHVDLSLF